jgi:hypothetical protein
LGQSRREKMNAVSTTNGGSALAEAWKMTGGLRLKNSDQWWVRLVAAMAKN